MDPLLCFPADLPAEVTLALQSAGLEPPGVGGARRSRRRGPTADRRGTRARSSWPETT